MSSQAVNKGTQVLSKPLFSPGRWVCAPPSPPPMTSQGQNKQSLFSHSLPLGGYTTSLAAAPADQQPRCQDLQFVLPQMEGSKNQSWIPGLGWPVSDQSIFGRHGLEVQSRTKLLVTRFLVVQPRLLFYSPNSRNYSGQETSWMGLPGSLASGQWKQASSTLAGMGAAPGRWWVGG